MIAVNVTANWQLIRTMDALFKRGTPAAPCSSPRASLYKGRAHRGPYGLEGRTQRAGAHLRRRTRELDVRANLFSPDRRRRACILGAAFQRAAGEHRRRRRRSRKATLPLCVAECRETEVVSFRRRTVWMLDEHRLGPHRGGAGLRPGTNPLTAASLRPAFERIGLPAM